MIPIFKETYAPDNFNEIPVAPRVASVIHQLDKPEWKNFWNFIRLNLQGRINGQETPDEIRRLQGKIELTHEMTQFFEKILEKKL